MGASKQSAILVIGFLLGAALMGVEMAAIRMMTPYFGSAIETWACMIATVMLSMMAGYFLGGVLADRAPRSAVLRTDRRTEPRPGGLQSLSTAAPHVKPLPKAAMSTFDPRAHLPSRQASERPSGIVAAVVLPYFSMLATVFDSGIPSF